MWSIIANPIVSHLLAAFLGAAAAWYATHRSILATAKVAIEASFDAAKTAIDAAATDVKKVV